jgi:hypothetical protein
VEAGYRSVAAHPDPWPLAREPMSQATTSTSTHSQTMVNDEMFKTADLFAVDLQLSKVNMASIRGATDSNTLKVLLVLASSAV